MRAACKDIYVCVSILVVRTLILGVSGQLGSELAALFPGSVGTVNTGGVAGALQLDVTDYARLEDLVLKVAPDVVVNAAAYTDVDGCERDRERAFAVNALAVKHLVRACRVVRCHLVHVSTDYVFDGSKGLYGEEDVPGPVNHYGLTKLMGECYALSYDDCLVLRTSGVFKTKGFPVLAYQRLRAQEKVGALRGYYSPISARRLALAVRRLVDLGRTGVLHVAGERVSRFELASRIAEKFGLPKLVEEVGDLGLAARRPFDSSLDTSRAKAILGGELLSLDASLDDLAYFVGGAAPHGSSST